MGAGNVKACRPPEPVPMRLPPLHTGAEGAGGGGGGLISPSKGALGFRMNSPASSLQSSALDSPLSPSLLSPSKRWDVTCHLHRTLICRFCGGASCKREDYRKQDDTPAITGLHSTWVSANVLAMQRPSTRLIRQFQLISAWKKAGVGAVVNLQLAGEHPHCGDGIHPEGFSYRAEELTDHGIFYYNPGWVDMDTPSLERMLEVVQLMHFHTSRSQKVAVHCHAGYGRTGIVIACFFVFALGLSAEDAVSSVRTRRPGSVQTSKQKRFVTEFAEYVAYLRRVYYEPAITPYAAKHVQQGSAPLTAQQQLLQQQQQQQQQLLPDVAGMHHAPISNGGIGAGGIGGEQGVSSGDEDSGGDEDLSLPPSHSALMNLVQFPPSSSSTASSSKGGAGPNFNAFTPQGIAAALAAGLPSFPPMLLSRRHAKVLSLVCSERIAAVANRYTLHEALSRQRAILHGEERQRLKFTPKVVSILCERLGDLATNNPPLLAAAVLEGFRKGGNLQRAFDEEHEREKERRRAKAKAAGGAGGGREASFAQVAPPSTNGVPPQTQQHHQPYQPSRNFSAGLEVPGQQHHHHGGLASISGAVPNRLSPSRTVATQGHGAANGLGGGGGDQSPSQFIPPLELSPLELSTPKWGPIQDELYADLKKQINSGEWGGLLSCDVRYCAQLLLEWLEQLKSPLLPLFERRADVITAALSSSSPAPGTVSATSTASGSSSAAALFSSPHTLYTSPLAFFSSLPRWTLASLDPVMRILASLRGLDPPTLARVLVRFGFALSHPRAQIPESILVFRAHENRVKQALGNKIASAGITLQALHQAAQASLAQQQQQQSNLQANQREQLHPHSSASMSGTNNVRSPTNARSPALSNSPSQQQQQQQLNFDAFHHCLPAPRSLLDALVEFLSSLTRAWGPAYAKVVQDEERLAASMKVGVRKGGNERIVEASMAQVAVGGGDSGGGGGDSQGQGSGNPSYHQEATKLVTQLVAPGVGGGGGGTMHGEGGANGHGLHLRSHASAEQTAFESPSREVSTTAYLHSHIHHAQPVDHRRGGGGRMGTGEQNSMLQSGMHHHLASSNSAALLPNLHHLTLPGSGGGGGGGGGGSGGVSPNAGLLDMEVSKIGLGGMMMDGSSPWLPAHSRLGSHQGGGDAVGGGVGSDGHALGDANTENSVYLGSSFDGLPAGAGDAGGRGADGGSPVTPSAAGAHLALASLLSPGATDEDKEDRLAGFLTQRSLRAQQQSSACGDVDDVASTGPAGLHASASTSSLRPLTHSLSGVELPRLQTSPSPRASSGAGFNLGSAASPEPVLSPSPSPSPSNVATSGTATAAAAAPLSQVRPGSAPRKPSSALPALPPPAFPRVVLARNPAAEKSPVVQPTLPAINGTLPPI